MPPPKFKTITVREDIYNWLWDEWQKKDNQYKMKYNVYSFSAFVSRFLYEMMKKERAREKRQQQIT